MSTKVIEAVTFNLVQGMGNDAFLESAKPTFAFLDQCTGFIRRQLSQNEDGSWLDYVEWRDMASAMSAAENFPKEPSCLPFMQAIQADSATMKHYTLKESKA